MKKFRPLLWLLRLYDPNLAKVGRYYLANHRRIRRLGFEFFEMLKQPGMFATQEGSDLIFTIRDIYDTSGLRDFFERSK